MGSVFPRRRKLWFEKKDANGKWVSESTGLDVGQEKQARKLLGKIENRIAAGLELTESGPVTLKHYAEHWLAERQEHRPASVHNDTIRLRKHVYPALGSMTFNEVRPRHVSALVKGLKKSGLTPRTVRHIYATLRKLCNDALVDEIIEVSPCVLNNRDLPENRDKDPTWRHTAVFTPGEVERLISAPEIPLHRRVRYAMLVLAGPRGGEAYARRWRDYDPDEKPLGRLSLVTKYSTERHREEPGTKTGEGAVRYVPVHPALAKLLRQWKLSGWAQYVGRVPTEDDLILVKESGDFLTNYRVRVNFHRDLETLGMRKRRVYDLRRSFVSIGRAHGMRKDVMQWISHGPRKDIIDMYTTLPWDLLCAEMSKMRIELREGVVVELPWVAVAGTASDGHQRGGVGQRETEELDDPLVHVLVHAEDSNQRGVELGGSARESNPPGKFLTPLIGFEDRGRHQPTKRFRERA